MFNEQRSQLLDKYQSLPDDARSIMQFLAVCHGYETATVIARNLSDLGVRGNQDKLFTAVSIKPVLEALKKDRLLEVQTGKNSYRCNRLIAESVVRQLVDDEQFERYASLFEKPTPIVRKTIYNNQGLCLRDARILFHRGNYDQVDRRLVFCSPYYREHQSPDRIDVYLSWLLNPLDIAWFKRRHPKLINNMAGFIGLHQLAYLYHDPDIFDFLAECASRDAGERLLSKAPRVHAELLLLRGDWDILAQQIAGSGDPELQALSAALAFFKGDFSGAIEQYETALKLIRKITGKKTVYFYGLAGIFYPLAILKFRDAHDKKLTTLLGQAIKINGLWVDCYRYLEIFQTFLQGDLGQRDNEEFYSISGLLPNGYEDNGEPNFLIEHPNLTLLFRLLIRAWMTDTSSSVDPDVSLETVRDLYQRLVDNGYRWPAAELAKLSERAQTQTSRPWDSGFLDGRPVTLTDLFARRPDWDLALDALLGLGNNGSQCGSVQTEKSTRMVWLVNFQEEQKRVWIEPREQKQKAKGGWSKGRAIALKRLHSERDNFDYLSDHDLKICSTIQSYTDSGSWYGRSTYYEFSEKMPLALVGHPLLFFSDSPDVRVEVIKGEPELLVRKVKGGNIKITFIPELDHQKNMIISKETPTRLKVIELTADHHKIHQLLGLKGLEVPVAAQERVLQTLTGISGLLTVQSDIGGSSSTAEQVEADATPRLHLLPFGEGLKVSLLIRPFSTGGAYYQPGQGGASVFAEIDGKPLQAKRDLKLEKMRCADVFSACPSLAEAERDDGGEYLLEDPEHCLELLLQLQSLPPDRVLLEWPEGVKFRLLGHSSGSGFKMQIKRDHDWFALQGELQVNEDIVIDIRQLLSLIGDRQSRFLQLQDGQFFALTDEFRRRLDDLTAYADLTGKKVRINPLAALTLEDWQDEAGFKADQHWQAHIQRLKAAREYQPAVPSTFQAELRDYQSDGFEWLARLAQWGVGACLADDMGLGKTIQALALLVEKAPNGPSLIIAPTSVCMNWESEALRFAPTLNPILFGSGDRQRKLDSLGPYDLLICSYGLLQQEQAAEMLSNIPFQIAILDEAQAIKNIATRRSQGAMNLQAEFRVIMTGTPLENHLGELWNLFRFINPGLLGSLEQFNKRFAGPIERDNSQEARQKLKKLIQPFILRRTKTQVLQELPQKTEIPVYVEMSGDEMAFYEALRRESLELLNSSQTQGGPRHLQILAAITKLRRSCCNTRLANANIVLPSSKLAAFGEIVDELLENKHKALVFSQFVDHLQLIKDYIEQRGIGYQYLDGSTPAKERKKRVDAFQRGEGELFLISLKAGGVGLNLTAADYVIHMDPWWNPAVEDQASDRAHRMGQQRPVTIYRMIAKDTIEEKIVALHSRKRDLADSLLEGADISGKMSADALLDLMRGE